jgi:hypothetical protein
MEYIKCDNKQESKYPVEYRLSTKRGKVKLMGCYERHAIDEATKKMTVELVWRELNEIK